MKTTTWKFIVKQYLENNAWSRERSNRNAAVWNIVMNQYPTKVSIDRELFKEVYTAIMSVTRMINFLQKNDKTLRGDDYENGKVLSQDTQIDLGYSPGHYQQVKTLKELTDDEDYG